VSTPVAAPPVGPREGQTFAGGSRLAVWASFVKLPHTVFALPFALVGVTLASYTHPVTPRIVAWVVVAFSAARFAAMAFNRVVDREWDARNPRTRMRELPQGKLGVGAAKASVVVSSAVFLLAAGMLNTLCLVLAPASLMWVLGYSYAKRFTRYAHLWLGFGLSIAPGAGWLAVTGIWPSPWWLPWVLASGVMTWVAGFDVLYALPDADFDRAHGLRSLPQSLGVPRALAVARALHVWTVVAFAIVGLALPAAGVAVGGLWWAGVGVVAALLAYEHSLVSAADLTKLDAAFFTMNGVISLTFFAFVLAGRLLGAGAP
jgi:4-hydroxybenzoate polyprenyltransferase